MWKIIAIIEYRNICDCPIQRITMTSTAANFSSCQRDKVKDRKWFQSVFNLIVLLLLLWHISWIESPSGYFKTLPRAVSCRMAEQWQGWTYGRDASDVIEMQMAESSITTLIPERFKLEHNVMVMEHLVVIKDDSAACHYKSYVHIHWSDGAGRKPSDCVWAVHHILMTAGTVRPHVEPGKGLESGRPCLPAHASTPAFSYTYCIFQIDSLLNCTVLQHPICCGSVPLTSHYESKTEIQTTCMGLTFRRLGMISKALFPLRLE